MSGRWREDDDEEYRVGGGGGGGGGRGGSRSKPRFSFTEIKLLLEEVKRNRFIILKKFNHGVSAETKKQTWAEITEQINDLGENRREVRQIMKKWADLKCDGKRRMVALRGPNGSSLRKKNLGPVERMVHKILLMSPGGDGDGDSDLDFGEDVGDLTKRRRKGPPPPPYSYLNITDTNPLPLPGGASFDLSPLSSPDKDLSGDPFHSSPDFEYDLAEDGDHTMDFDDDDDDEDSMFAYRASFPTPASVPLDPLPDDALLRTRPVHTYSRNHSGSQGHASSSSKPPPPAGPAPSTSNSDPAAAAASSSSSSVAPPAPPPSTSHPAPSSSSSSSIPPLPPAYPATASPQDHVAQLASQSLQQQQAGRLLLASVSQSLETLAQSVQLLVESQQEFVQESLALQRETVDILRDFSSTALAMLREKANSGQAPAPQQQPASQF
ncbi:uncharacterized protein [Centroberyx affinis]|uniref:uncharacterized protein n=1 Tax=Centroberyx affinis TaxID=166261 RepID=UPI003A5C49FE